MTSSTKPPLRPFQSEGVAWLSKVGRGILADDMGLGKSRQLIEASEGRTLIVAPAMVLSGGTWDDEIAKWADNPARFEQVAYSQLKKVRGTSWDTLILDEAHYIKGRQAIRTAEALALAKRSERLFLATGTPIPNYAPELFTLLQAVDPDLAKPGERLGSYWRWVQQWFQVGRSRYSDYEVGGLLACDKECAKRSPWDPCRHYHDFVRANLGQRFLQRRREDVLTDLPPLTRVRVKTPMTAKQRAEYGRMKQEYLAEVDDTTVVAWSNSAQHVKLDRITTGLGLLGDPPTATDSGKLARLADDLRDRSRPTVVMAHYRVTVEACAQVARDLGVRVAVVHGGVSHDQRRVAVRAFQAGKVDVLVGSLETLAEGLTLVQADMLIFVEQSYKPSRNQQAERRIHRMGQEHPCTVLDYVVPKSVDENKRKLLATKTDGQMRVLTAAQFKQLL